MRSVRRTETDRNAEDTLGRRPAPIFGVEIPEPVFGTSVVRKTTPISGAENRRWFPTAIRTRSIQRSMFSRARARNKRINGSSIFHFRMLQRQ